MLLINGVLVSTLEAQWGSEAGWRPPDDSAQTWRFGPEEAPYDPSARSFASGGYGGEATDWRDGRGDLYSVPDERASSERRFGQPRSPYEAGFERPAPSRYQDWSGGAYGDPREAFGKQGFGSNQGPEIELDLSRTPSYGGINQPERKDSRFRFRGDPSLPAARSRGAPWGDQYRFRPLAPNEQQAVESETHWRPWKEESQDLPQEPQWTPNLFDSMSGAVGSPPNQYSPWRSR
ncbi:hypothetical protein G3480_09840 [Thiorhodococcus mannitoliphagus]|uniref:Uncharacterized protein n=1 Tax=Thiorhodococcus mannitoliphagus TaxID=329406 RepID=A0A6P1DYF0_9GAMM|nr:hypothetical protein [Thiorhodococcus mannitoliphagus]NEX20605.1 hypothetical protein [Thiorhodococcus mannitoliphagus]